MVPVSIVPVSISPGKYYDDDGDGNVIENATFVAHVPQIVVEDEIIKMSCSDGESKGLDISKLFEQGFLGANGIDTVEHPEGDGYFVVGGSI
ncbi:hypothetical protein [Aliikangiella sp. G2MR2-5]|uniref:hypothetical protein n=1 Tax=Aliikangiella sp. G2MR2-5 TaxID=2788943 RepID=UPI0018AA4995|nr:hypothetical protein [Aliikangiella sp. G2MR2-5]